MRSVSRTLGAFILLVVVACQGSSRPREEDLLGEWETLCFTDKESTSTCPGKDDHGLYMSFRPGGKLVRGAGQNTPWDGKWTLTGDTLEIVFEGGGIRIKETYRARLVDGRLVLWNAERGKGKVHGRVGAPFEPAATKTSAGGPTSHAIGGVGYTLTLPAGYRLSRDDNNRQQWSPSAGPGFTVNLSLSPRARTQVDGQWVTPPCNDYDYGGVLGAGGVVDGVERDTSIGRSRCLEGSDQALSCNAEHTRGYLEKSELDAALALCDSLVVAG